MINVSRSFNSTSGRVSMNIDMTVRMRKSHDGTPLPVWLTEGDEVFVSTCRLLRGVWDDGYIKDLEEWGLSVLPHQKIAMGPLNEHRFALAILPMTEIIEEANRKNPKRNPARFWVYIVRNYLTGSYIYRVLDPQERRACLIKSMLN